MKVERWWINFIYNGWKMNVHGLISFINDDVDDNFHKWSHELS
jgi:hypothetical protein